VETIGPWQHFAAPWTNFWKTSGMFPMEATRNVHSDPSMIAGEEVGLCKETEIPPDIKGILANDTKQRIGEVRLRTCLYTSTVFDSSDGEERERKAEGFMN
jgi:hypothetical protein